MATNKIEYFNCTIVNPTNAQSPSICTSTINTSSAILSNIKDYYGSIIRCNISQFMIPVTFFLVQTPVTNINLGVYSFTLAYKGVYSNQTFLIWIPTNSTSAIPPTGTATQTQSNYYFCYSYQTFINIMNTALKEAFADLQAKTTGLNAGDYPFITYDSGLQQLKLYAPMAYDQNDADPVLVYCNTQLQPFLHGFRILTNTYTGTNNGCNFLIDIRSLPDENYLANQVQVNLKTLLLMSQEASCLSYWNMLRSVIISSTLPINSESNYSSNGATIFENIVTDYTPDLSGPDEALICAKQNIYNASSLYRLFEFKNSASNLNCMNLSIKFTDNDNNLYPLELFPGMRCDIKFMFVHKSLVNFSL